MTLIDSHFSRNQGTKEVKIQLICFRQIIRFGPYVTVVPFLFPEMLLVLIGGYYKTVELWKVCTSLASVSSQQSNHHMSTACHRIGTPSEKIKQKKRESHGGGFIPWVSFLMGNQMVFKAWAPPTGTGWSGVTSPNAAPMTQINKHYFCSLSPPRPKVTNVFLMDCLLGLCSRHSWLPSWKAASW